MAETPSSTQKNPNTAIFGTLGKAKTADAEKQLRKAIKTDAKYAVAGSH